MILNKTFSIVSTSSRTWVPTFLIMAGFVSWTIGIYDTFWPATLIWIAVVIRQTLAGTGSVSFCAYSIRSTWRWIAWLYWFFLNSYWNRWTQRKGITRKANFTCTHRRMRYNTAYGWSATHSNAWIFTFLINTSHIARTFGIGNAFGSAVRCWTYKSFKTRTRRYFTFRPTLWIGATRWRSARILWHSVTLWRLDNGLAANKRIASVARQTSTERTVINCGTLSISSTRSWTRINTFLIDAGQGSWAIWICCTFRSTCWWRS